MSVSRAVWRRDVLSHALRVLRLESPGTSAHWVRGAKASAMDCERLLSECGDPPPVIGDADGAEESAGQRSSRTVGVWVGTRGSLLTDVMNLIPAKFLKKFCVFCKITIVERDAVDVEYSVCWHKPKFEGRACGWCGAAKTRLHPLESTQVVANVVSDPHILITIQRRRSGSTTSQITCRTRRRRAT